jgi:O-antigen ligase
MIKKYSHSRVFHLSLLLGVLALPHGNFLAHFFAPALVAWIILMIGGYARKPDWKRLLIFTWPAFFFLLYLFSLFTSGNKSEAGFQVEQKTALFLMPLICLFIPVSGNLLVLLVRFFCLSLFTSVIICTAIALFRFRDGNAAHLFSSDLSWFLHPSYFAMYLVFAFYFLIAQLQKGKPVFSSRKFNWILIISFSLFIFMLASKMGWLCFVVVAGWLFSVEMTRRKQVKLIIAGFILLSATALLLYRFVPVVNEKMNNLFAATEENKIDKTTTESSGVRILIWKSSKEIIGRNFWTGVGSGQVNDSLNAVYKKNGYTGALEKNLNAHNQFFQSFIAFGVWGLLVFCLMLVFPLFVFKASFPVHGLWFILIMAINFSVESILQNQAGVVFFAFFYSVILVGRKVSEKDLKRK